MSRMIETVVDLDEQQSTVRRRAYGVIETRDERFLGIQFRPWPKFGSVVESLWASGWGKRRNAHNRCLLYFSQPLFHRNFLSLNYVVSSWKTSMATTVLALAVLDRVAELKKSDAILCQVTNSRITDRVMKRFGWEPQNVHKRRRHWIKRFYGNYPDSTAYQQLQATLRD